MRCDDEQETPDKLKLLILVFVEEVDFQSSQTFFFSLLLALF